VDMWGVCLDGWGVCVVGGRESVCVRAMPEFLSDLAILPTNSALE
jgi:hypothetical protein